MSRRSSIMVQKTYYQIGVITLITAVMWVLFSVYNALTKTPDVGVDAAILSPLQARIDETTVASISGRTQLSKTALEQLAGIPQAEPSTTPKPATINEVTEVPVEQEQVVEEVPESQTETVTQ